MNKKALIPLILDLAKASVIMTHAWKKYVEASKAEEDGADDDGHSLLDDLPATVASAAGLVADKMSVPADMKEMIKTQAANAASSAVEKAGDVLGSAGSSARDATESLKDKASDTLTVPGVVSDQAGTITDFVENAAGSVKSAAEETAARAASTASNLSEGVADAAGAAAGRVKNVAEGAAETLSDATGALPDEVTDAAGTAAQKAKGAARGAFDQVTGTTGGTIDTITEGLGAARETLSKTADAGATHAESAARTLGDRAGSLASSVTPGPNSGSPLSGLAGDDRPGRSLSGDHRPLPGGDNGDDEGGLQHIIKEMMQTMQQQTAVLLSLADRQNLPGSDSAATQQMKDLLKSSSLNTDIADTLSEMNRKAREALLRYVDDIETFDLEDIGIDLPKKQASGLELPSKD